MLDRNDKLLLLLSLPFFLAGISLSHGQEEPHMRYNRLRAVLTTTSDWTSVSPEDSSGVSFAVANSRVTEGEDAPHLTIGDMSIAKKAYDSTEVSVEFFLYSSEIPEDSFSFIIRKGDIGETTLTLYNENAKPPKLIGTYENAGTVSGDPMNAKTFAIDSELIQAGGPLEAPDAGVPKLVLAFYYPWYGSPSGPSRRWVHWDPANHYASTDTPEIGYYDSQSEETIRKHMEFARDASIDGFIVSWWGIDTFEDKAFGKLLDVARDTDIKATIYYEIADDRRQIVSELLHVLDKYGSHPSFLKRDGTPVVFVYGRVTYQFQPEDWNFVFDSLAEKGAKVLLIADGFFPRLRRRFDGVHTYNPVATPFPETKRTYQNASFASRVEGKIFAATVCPGYDDTVIRDPGLKVPRKEGAYYKKSWEVALSSNPHWILITSFNEWHEGSEVEPSEEYGDNYLRITRRFADEWRPPGQSEGKIE